ncbi:hypothetical protein LAJ19_14985 (plasmid) [Deinococcus taeanensis]|uniref:hypothetical protein n=1 Tax=Deinococcus taeanensis TaxID=2737050 RepID=UPI001CDBBC0F|nr:hypothetical protein [Deinococcus taeanensis]UBV44111.1 hypothetical protein LAJ19_14985 [Deinococcus taeanensis]
MAAIAAGPTMAGGTQPIVKDGYELIYYPDVHNDALQREGKAPVFYYMPNFVHIARKNGREDGDFMFNLIRFSGVQDQETTVGAEEHREVAGGVVTFTVNSAPPDHVLRESQEQITAQFRASQDFFWGIRTNVPPVFRPVPIVSNITAVSNVSPLADGTVPVPAPAAPTRGHGLSGGITRGTMPTQQTLPRTWPATKDASGGELGPWFWRLQGQGSGSIDPMGQNAYSALLGAYPTAILWQAFHGTSSPIVVMQNLKIKMWAPMVEIRIRGRWKKVFDHFSAAVHAHYLWASADIKAEFNNMRTNGDIEVEIAVDPTIPGAGDIQAMIDKRTDLVFEKFMAEAQKVIFEPPQPQVPPAEASSGGGPWGVGVALKYRHDNTELELNYHERREMAFLQETTISSSLEGMADEIKRDPNAEKKYFLTADLDGWPRKLGRVFKAVVNWTSQPVAFVSCQVGYPNQQGEIMWSGHAFQKSDSADASWSVGFSMKELTDVTRPPQDWAPDKTFIRRRIHLTEPPTPQESPFTRTQVEVNTIELDPEPNGTPMNDVTIEVRADSAGTINVGPITLGVQLEDTKQVVEVTLEPTDARGQPLNKEPVKFAWHFADQDTPRYWQVFTGDKNVRPFFRYRVRVIVKGSLTSRGMEWESVWQNTSGNGDFTVRVPLPDDPDVAVKRELPSFLTSGAAPQVSAGTGSTVSSPPPGSMVPPSSRDLPAAGALDVGGWALGPQGEQRDTPEMNLDAPPPSGRRRDDVSRTQAGTKPLKARGNGHATDDADTPFSGWH